jgi:hypothetical protein
MPYQPDIVVTGADGQPRLFVEVKTGAFRSDPDELRRWATEYRSDRFADLDAGSSFFLFAHPRRFFFWAPREGRDAQPTFEADPASLLASATNRLADSLHQLRPWALELVVATWLHVLAENTESALPPDAEWIAASGLLDVLREGFISTSATV